jgi:RNA-binding protein
MSEYKAIELSGKQKRSLRAMAHSLKPVVQVGNAGLSDAVLNEIDLALSHHELIKVRMHGPEDKKVAADALAQRAGAALCGVVGHTVILFRPNPDDPKVVLTA